MFHFRRYSDCYNEDYESQDPRIEIRKGENSYQVLAELPGIEEKDISVNVENNFLTISAESKVDENNEYEVSYSEISNRNKLNRKIRLGTEIDSEKVSAELKDGVLKIELPLSEKTRPKKIEIKAA